jgi:hypothetical protein
MDNYTGPERRAAGVTKRFVVIVAALLVLYVTAVFAYSQEKFGDVDENSRQTTYLNQLDSCVRGLDIRDESDGRIPAHITDAQNLLNLAAALTNTRAKEAEAFEAINRRIPGQIPEIDALVKTYKQARDTDRKIAESQQKITFSLLGTVNCLMSVKKPDNTDVNISQKTRDRIKKSLDQPIPVTTLTEPTTPIKP